MASEKKCMVCGKVTPEKSMICEPCQDRIRREAMGEQASTRSQAENELRKQGVDPDQGRKRK